VTKKSRNFLGRPPLAGKAMDNGLERIFAGISQMKPQSSTDSTRYVDQNIDDAGASIGHEGLM